MATQEDRSKTIATGTADGLLAFCDYLIDKGYGTSGGVTPWKSAAKQIFEAVEGDGWGSLDLRGLDLNDYIRRFENMERGHYKAESIQSYGSRLRRAMEAYLAFLEDGRTPTLRQGPRRQNEQPNGKAAKDALPSVRSEGRGTASASPIADLVEYPFPLRSGQLAYVRLPKRVEKDDAERLAAFVRTLVFEPQRQLPAGNDDTDQEQS